MIIPNYHISAEMPEIAGFRGTECHILYISNFYHSFFNLQDKDYIFLQNVTLSEWNNVLWR
jgi:hypothetical protein